MSPKQDQAVRSREHREVLTERTKLFEISLPSQGYYIEVC